MTGGTGRVGRHIVNELADRGAAVRVATRDLATVEPRRGVEAVLVDFAEPMTFEAAVRGVDAAYVMWPFFSDGAQAAAIVKPIADVLGQHVRRVVYLSSQAASAQPNSFWAVIERAIEDQVVEWTMLRPTGFAVNAQSWADQIRVGDTVRWPFGQVKRPLIHERDIAAVATVALTQDGYQGQRPVITGPESLSQEEQVALIGAALGRHLQWHELDREQAERELDVSADMLDAWQDFLAHPEPVTDEVARITGNAPRSFASWAREHTPDFSRSI